MAKYFYIEFRISKSAGSHTLIGDIINVYAESEVGALTRTKGRLGYIKITDMPDSATVDQLKELLAKYYIDETIEPGQEGYRGVPIAERKNFHATQWRNIKEVNIDISDLPEPYKSDLEDRKVTTMSASVIMELLYHRKLKRKLNMGDI